MSDTCSAVPADLEAYGAAGLRMDALLRAQGARLQDALNRLMASHPDPTALGRVPPVGHNLVQFATTNANTDVWVGNVGKAFERANRHGGARSGSPQTASRRAIDSWLKGEDPHESLGEEILAKLDPKAKGSIVGNWRSVRDWLIDNVGFLQTNWGFFAMGGQLPLLLSPLTGFRLTFDGGWTIVHAPRLGGTQSSFLKRYLWSGNLDRLSYLKGDPQVAKYYRPLTAMGQELSAAFNPRDVEFLKGASRGGGVVSSALTVAGDVYSYTLGGQKRTGLLSNDFAAATTVDLGTTAAGIAASAGASAGVGALASGALGAEIGSVVPGAGTAVGLAVGLGIGYLMGTDLGKSIRSTAIHGLSSGLEHVEDWGGSAVHSIGHFFGGHDGGGRPRDPRLVR